MTGPEHYREAEAVIAQVKNRDVPADVVIAHAAVAQVHAALALAAATADPLGSQWQDATGGPAS